MELIQCEISMTVAAMIADRLAIKCLGVLGLRFLGISLQELFEKINIKFNSFSERIQPYSKQLFARMLDEGFQEAHLHKK
jgi:hypothetical protein